ncbi:hypothetical protein VW29_14820 [Devosia limi DSM 17137]|uniref:AraC-type DNA-binding protein n=1 Tax=Devosia limi DSM 17137 TaxID=1121477 RepID=A0A0F5LKE8_9HYPH|nr:helix-turn-helix domain-containing protein [Devosia limi]KKB82828.1 hypothetical protein VW29_14820 [Devosia limi DSM 17137]SHF48700.1 AraC-type DNA-binding protein [Devosia limi DSM 17137]
MSIDRANVKAGIPLGKPHIAMDLVPTGDGRAFSDWQTSTSFISQNSLLTEEDAAAFHGSAQIFFLGRLVLLESTASHPTRMLRTGLDVARSDVDLLQICLLTKGVITGRGEPAFRVGPGDICFIDCSQPFECEVSGFAMTVLLVPRDALPSSLSDYLVHGLVLKADRPATAILAQLMRQTYEMAPSLSHDEAEAAARAAVSLAFDLFKSGLSPKKDLASAPLDLLGAAQARIERLLENPELSAAMLQKQLRVSRATLYELFVPNGGVQAYIRERRLQRCYEILRSNHRPNDTIGTVAFSLGFRSEAHFSRAFKDRFGLSPRTLRLEARRQSGDLQPALVAGIAPHMIQALVHGDAK